MSFSGEHLPVRGCKERDHQNRQRRDYNGHQLGAAERTALDMDSSRCLKTFADGMFCKLDTAGALSRQKVRHELGWGQSAPGSRASSGGAPSVPLDQDHQRPKKASNRKPNQTRVSHLAVPGASSCVGTPTFFGHCDDSRYWDYAFRAARQQDLGHRCKECKMPFTKLNETVAVRRGGRIELKYHEQCFSMMADPRSQPASTANVGKFVQTLQGTRAPQELYRKMRTRGHW